MGESGTRIGDLLGSLRVAPLILIFFCYVFELDIENELITQMPIALERDIEHDLSIFTRRGNIIRIVRAGVNGCDHTSTNAPDPIRTSQLSVLGREWY